VITGKRLCVTWVISAASRELLVRCQAAGNIVVQVSGNGLDCVGGVGVHPSFGVRADCCALRRGRCAATAQARGRLESGWQRRGSAGAARTTATRGKAAAAGGRRSGAQRRRGGGGVERLRRVALAAAPRRARAAAPPGSALPRSARPGRPAQRASPRTARRVASSGAGRYDELGRAGRCGKTLRAEPKPGARCCSAVHGNGAAAARYTLRDKQCTPTTKTLSSSFPHYPNSTCTGLPPSYIIRMLSTF